MYHPPLGRHGSNPPRCTTVQVNILLAMIYIHTLFSSKSLRSRVIGTFFVSAKVVTSHQRKVRKRSHSWDKTSRNLVKLIHVTGAILQTSKGSMILILVSDLISHRFYTWQVFCMWKLSKNSEMEGLWPFDGRSRAAHLSILRIIRSGSRLKQGS